LDEGIVVLVVVVGVKGHARAREERIWRGWNWRLGHGAPRYAFAPCCAPAESGHAAAAPPSKGMNARRLMFSLILSPHPPGSTRDFAERVLRNAGSGYRSVCLDVGRPDHRAPLLSFVDEQLIEVAGRAWKGGGTQLGEPRLHLGIGEGRIDLLV